MASKNKRKKTKIKKQNNLQAESKKLDSLPPKQDPIVKTETEKLFEKVKAKVEAIKAAKVEKAYPLEKKIENGGPDDLRDLPNVSQGAEVTGDTGPLLVSNRVQKLVNVKKKKKMKKKKKVTPDVKIQTLLKQLDNISSIVRCCPTCFDPVKESLIQVLAEYKVLQPVSNSGSNPKIIKCENDNSAILKPKKKKMKKKKKKTTDVKTQKLLKQSDNTSPIVGCGPASFDPVKESLVQELPECEVLQPVSNSGSNPKIFKCENDNSTVLKPKKKKMKKKKKKKTTDVKTQKLLKQSDNTSPIVGCGPASFDPVKESLVQELPECEVPRPVSNSGSNPTVLKCENEKSTVLKPKKKKMKKKKKKKATNIKIQTLLEQSDNTSLIVGCGPASFDPLKESLVQELPECENIKLESLPKKQDPLSKNDSEKLLEEVKVNTEALKAAKNMNAPSIPFHDMSASTPDKAYPLEKIIEKEEWNCLDDLLNIPQGAKLTPEAYPIFVCNRVQKLEEMKDEYEKKTVASVLQYITHLIKYKEKHSLHGYESAKNHIFPSVIEEKFRAMFNESSSKSLSSGKRKLLINYVLVLTLFVDGYQSDPSDITKDLRTNVPEVIKQYKLLGCKISRKKPVPVVTLAVPLKFPVLRTSKK